MVPDSDLVIMYPPSTQLGDGLVTASLDTYGYDFADIIISDGTYAVAGKTLPTTVRIGQSPTAIGAMNQCTNIVSLTGGTATSATVGFVIGGVSTTKAGATHFKVDLRNVDRYLCLEYDLVGTGHLAAYALMRRPHTGPKAAVATTTLDAVRSIAAG